MQAVNLRQLRDTKQLKLWLKAGETVELRERDTVLGRIVPEQTEKAPVEWPDFEARAKAIFGNRVFEKNAVLEAREDSRY
jgi:antitoxin (DNA-binding transcriptional repressor) of toxin-antitoxin stability system